MFVVSCGPLVVSAFPLVLGAEISEWLHSKPFVAFLKNSSAFGSSPFCSCCPASTGRDTD